MHNAIQSTVNCNARGNYPQGSLPDPSQYQGHGHGNRPGLHAGYYEFEVDFMGELHDSPVSLSLAPDGNKLSPDGTPDPQFVVVQSADPGTTQYATSIAMTNSGSFVEMWNQADFGNNLFFRTFTESTDTAGPSVTDFLLPTAAGARHRPPRSRSITARPSSLRLVRSSSPSTKT